uniref:Uncharacterized protein n=1 Tax=Romanomermis culicivorax TaxID=13658 RepID=A0A915KF68_ROMCU
MVSIFLSFYKKRGKTLSDSQPSKTTGNFQNTRNSVANQQKIMRQSKVLACIAISNTVLVTVPNFIYIFALWFGFGEQTGQNLRFVGLVTNGLRCTLMLPLCIALRQDFRTRKGFGDGKKALVMASLSMRTNT